MPATAAKSLARDLDRIPIYSHDLEGDRCQFLRLARKGAKAAEIIESTSRPGYSVLVVTVRRGSEAEKLARRMQSRGELLIKVGEAILDGRAFLETAWGRRKVINYNDRTGDAVTRNDGEGWLSQRTFMVCVDQIQIEGE